MSDCVFCKIVAGRLPAAKVHEDDSTLAFMDIGEVNPGHVLVVAKPHVENIYGLDDALAGALLATAARVARAVKAAYSPEGITLYQANGIAAGQTVFHFHIHVVPRYRGDGLKLVWHSRQPAPEQLEASAAKIRASLALTR